MAKKESSDKKSSGRKISGQKISGEKISGEKITVEQYRSSAGRTQEVRGTLTALGLGRIGKKKELVSNPAVLGMISRVSHLIRVIK